MIGDLKNYLAALSLIISISGTIYFWLSFRSRGNEKGLNQLGDKVGAIDMRVAKIEGEMEHLPTKEGQHRLELAMSEMAGDMKQMAEALKSHNMTVRRMEDVLMKRGNKS